MSQSFTPGFGAVLAAARESRGLTIAEVAERLKLSPRQIEAIEAEDWSALPDPVFVRGFVRNYARIVGLKPEELMPAVNSVEAVTQTITAPSAGVRLGSSPVARWLLLPLLLVILFVTVVVGLYTWLRQGEHALLPGETAVPAQEPAPTAPNYQGGVAGSAALPLQGAAQELAPTQPVAPLPESPVAPPAPSVSTGEPAPPTPAARSQSDNPPTPPVAPAGGANAATKAAPAETSGQISMRFAPAEDSWIQVVDGKGRRFSKLVRGGSSEVVSGTPPFRLVVGNAATVNLVYNGHAIDLKPYIGEKVARLTLE